MVMEKGVDTSCERTRVVTGRDDDKLRDVVKNCERNFIHSFTRSLAARKQPIPLRMST